MECWVIFTVFIRAHADISQKTLDTLSLNLGYGNAKVSDQTEALVD